jgi:hypothetical protein
VDDTSPAPADPGQGPVHPELAVPDPAVPPPPVPALPGSPAAAVPVTLRSEGVDAGDTGGREGVGSAMVVAIGIAVACLRGMSQWLADRRQRFEDLAPVREAAAKAKAEKIKARAEHEAALAKIGHDAAQARAKGRIQSPTEFGRSTKNSSGGKSGGTFGPKADGKTRPTTSNELAAKRPRKTPDAQKAADARREAKKDAARPENKKPGPLERMRRKSDGSGGKDGTPGKGSGKRQGPLERMRRRGDGGSGGKDSGKKPGSLERMRRRSDGGSGGKDSGKKPSGPKPGTTKPGAAKGGTAGPPKEKAELTKKPKAPKGSKTAPPKPTSPKAGGKKRKPPKAGGRKPRPPWAWRKKPKAGPASAPSGTGTGTGGPKGTSGPTSSRPGSRSRRTRGQTPPPRTEPRESGEWLRPPPGMDSTPTVTVERTDRKPPEAKTPAAIAPARPGLPAGTAPEPLTPPAPASRNTRSSTTTGPAAGRVPAPRKEARPMSGAPAVRDTQFTDSDLTVYDVIESDEDMSEQILLGAVHARHVAERCQRLQSALEEMRAELIAKSVPGVFVGWCTRLIERAGVVETKADAVADGLPRASEAIAHAGQLAAEHDKPVADVVRDMGHTAPADASYHKE